MTLDLLARDLRRHADRITAQAKANTPDGHLPNEYLRYLDLAADLLDIAYAEITRDGLYLATEPTDLDTADPDVDALLAEYVTAGAS